MEHHGYRLTPPPQPGAVTVNADDLDVLLRGDECNGLEAPDDWPCRPCEARDNLAAALAETDRGR